MFKTRLYIIQFLGIIMLLGSYLVGNQPDRLSVMHFDSDPACPSVIRKNVKHVIVLNKSRQSTSDSHSGHKSKAPKHFSFTLTIPYYQGFSPVIKAPATYTLTFPEDYSYLFYEEINPPPPRLC